MVTETSVPVVSPKRNRKLQAGLDLARSKQLYSPLPVKRAPSQPNMR